jgi:gamma-glutamyl-gamma-aminobutyrate hydrolase PuuD
MPAGATIIGSALYADAHFGATRVVHDPSQLHGVDLLVLHGGEDISPSIYGEVAVMTHASNNPSVRDLREMELVHAAVKEGIPILGICRGAQLLCAMHGGHLYQHVDNHGVGHQIKVGNNIFYSNSAHHQMMIPDKEAEVLGVAVEVRSPKKYRQMPHPIEAKDPEPEIVWFPKFRALGVQGHPEWLPANAPLNQCVAHFLNELVNVEVFQ